MLRQRHWKQREELHVRCAHRDGRERAGLRKFLRWNIYEVKTMASRALERAQLPSEITLFYGRGANNFMRFKGDRRGLTGQRRGSFD